MRPLLMIPGPVEMSQGVLAAAATPGTSHVDPAFVAVFGRVLKNVREVFLAPDGQPFVFAGSGALGWDAVACNCLEQGDEVLALTHGYFGDAFVDVLTNQGLKVTVLACPTPGSVVSLQQLQAVHDWQRFKLVTITHVDTSTAVLAPLQEYCKYIRAQAPNVLIAVDGVAATGGETLRMTEWDIDFVMTASQKALAAPAGLSISVARPRALKAAASRKTPVFVSYMSWARWIPIMQAYEGGKTAYFATPAVSLVYALDVALREYLADGGVEQRFKDHLQVAAAFRAGIASLGLSTVAVSGSVCANTLTAIKYPAGITPEKLLADIKANGAIVAGGLHKDIKATYFRCGHMGHSVHNGRRDHVSQLLAAIEAALLAQGVPIVKSSSLVAFNAALDSKAAL